MCRGLHFNEMTSKKILQKTPRIPKHANCTKEGCKTAQCLILFPLLAPHRMPATLVPLRATPFSCVPLKKIICHSPIPDLNYPNFNFTITRNAVPDLCGQPQGRRLRFFSWPERTGSGVNGGTCWMSPRNCARAASTIAAVTATGRRATTSPSASCVSPARALFPQSRQAGFPIACK